MYYDSYMCQNFLGTKEVKKIILLSVTYPIILIIMNYFKFNFLQETPDKILICIYYGVIMGTGTGMVLKKAFLKEVQIL